MSVLSEDIRQRILAYLARYPSKQAVTLPALHIVQDALGHVDWQATKEVADVLDLPPSAVMDTILAGGLKPPSWLTAKVDLFMPAATVSASVAA